MSNDKKFKLKESDIKELVPRMGYCMATDKITVEGLCVGYMYREEAEDVNDSGWRFFSGTETQEYIDNPDNIGIYDVNTIANYDNAVIPYLNEQMGAELNRIEDTDDFE
jgi:hypothetical protein